MEYEGFQGQERQAETGWSSFKWRNSIPELGRFFNIDPLSEKYAYQSHYNFSENRVTDGRELEGLEWIPLFRTAPAPVVPNSGTTAGSSGIYETAKSNAINNYNGILRILGNNAKIITTIGGTGIGIANRILNSEGDDKSENSGSSTEKEKTTLEKNRAKGKKGENAVTEELKNEFPEDEVLTQVTGKFKDGKTTVFDNVILDGQTKKVKETNETKTGNSKLSKPQKRYRNGESLELTGKRAGDAKGQKINVNETPDRVTRR